MQSELMILPMVGPELAAQSIREIPVTTTLSELPLPELLLREEPTAGGLMPSTIPADGVDRRCITMLQFPPVLHQHPHLFRRDLYREIKELFQLVPEEVTFLKRSV